MQFMRIIGYIFIILGFISTIGFAGSYFISSPPDRLGNLVSMLPDKEMIPKEDVEKVLYVSVTEDSNLGFLIILSAISMLLGAVLIEVSGKKNRKRSPGKGASGDGVPPPS